MQWKKKMMKHLKFHESRRKKPQLWFLNSGAGQPSVFFLFRCHINRHMWYADLQYQPRRPTIINRRELNKAMNRNERLTHARRHLYRIIRKWHFRMGRVTILLMHPDGMMMMTMIILAGHLWSDRFEYGANHYLIICIWWQSNWNNFSIEMERKKWRHVHTKKDKLARQTVHTKKKTIKLRGRKREREKDECRRRRKNRNGRVVHVAFATACTFNTCDP